MKTIADWDNLKIPDYSLPYLINGDDNGLSDEDRNTIDGYMLQYYELAEENNGHVIIGFEHSDEEPFFTWNPEFGLACNVMTCTIQIVK